MTTETAVRPDAVSKLLAMSDIITPIAIRAAATHRVVSGLAAGQTVAEIAADRGLDVEVLDTLVRFLGEIGILDGDPTTPAPTEIGTITLLGVPCGLFLASSGSRIKFVCTRGSPSFASITAIPEPFFSTMRISPDLSASIIA